MGSVTGVGTSRSATGVEIWGAAGDINTREETASIKNGGLPLLWRPGGAVAVEILGTATVVETSGAAAVVETSGTAAVVET